MMCTDDKCVFNDLHAARFAGAGSAGGTAWYTGSTPHCCVASNSRASHVSARAACARRERDPEVRAATGRRPPPANTGAEGCAFISVVFLVMCTYVRCVFQCCALISEVSLMMHTFSGVLSAVHFYQRCF